MSAIKKQSEYFNDFLKHHSFKELSKKLSS